ncbi:MAG: DUF4159 domain-containing protein, partial [Phycisphaerae bacterium]|nr:DUF4159 domain-containing protein [Phycisphaerae bacterium]
MLRHALLALTLALAAVALPATGSAAEGDRPGLVRCANLTYARNKTSVCFAHHFLADVQQKTNVWTAKKFDKAKMESQELFNFPFAVISGEGAFRLTEPQQKNLRAYLTGGGFLVASPGCSSEPWRTSFRREVAEIFPALKLTKIPFDHPIFHTVYDITELKTKSKKVKAEL